MENNTPKNAWLRWFLVLPAGIAAYVLTNIVGFLILYFITGIIVPMHNPDSMITVDDRSYDLGNFLFETLGLGAYVSGFIKQVVAPAAFVLAGAITAPSRQTGTVTILSVVAGIGLFLEVLMMWSRSQTFGWTGVRTVYFAQMPAPIWWLFLSSIAGIFGLVFICYLFRKNQKK